jgi:catalase
MNYFQEIEQAAFSPSTMVPGIAPSADIMLQARMFSYPDAQRYRLGANYQQLPCNAAKSPVYSPYQRDGPGTINGNYGPDPDYVRSSFKIVGHGPKDIEHEKWVSQVSNYSSDVNEDDYVQARDLWALFGKTNQQEEFIHNLCGHLKKAIPETQAGTISTFHCPYNCTKEVLTGCSDMWSKVDNDLGKRITEKLISLDHEGKAKKLQECVKK